MKPICKLTDTNGNVFNLMGTVATTLKENDLKDKAFEMSYRVMHSGSYKEALKIMADYVEVE